MEKEKTTTLKTPASSAFARPAKGEEHTVSPEECRRIEQAIRRERQHDIELGGRLDIKLPFQH